MTRSCYHRDLHSFPTRRSSDLEGGEPGNAIGVLQAELEELIEAAIRAIHAQLQDCLDKQSGELRIIKPRATLRSEEHTSELQSRRDLVCRLLLEKKKEHDLHKP